ncbi:MAG: hypothetical protein ACXABY_29735, partial [Candidatus Thorarchaeota archaeon]
MPLVGQDDVIGQVTINDDIRNPVNMDSVMDPTDTLLDITKSAFSQENIIGSELTRREVLGEIQVDEGKGSARPLSREFRFENHIPQGYGQYAEMYAFTNNAEEAGKVTKFIDRRIQEESILRRNGATGIAAAVTAGIMDPTILIPGVGVLKGAKGARIAKGAATGAVTGGVAIGLQEAALQASQGATRPQEVSRNAVLAGIIFGGIMGSAIGVMSKGARAGSQAAVSDAVSDTQIGIRVSPEGKMTAEASGALKNAEGLARINENLAKWSGGPEISRSISLRGVTSEFGTVRKVTNDLFDHNFLLGKELAGEARGPVFVGASTDVGAYAQSKMQGKLSFAEFDREIGKAMRRGDTHKIPQVQKAARELRSQMEEKVSKMQELGLLDETLDPKTSTTYFMRRYKTNDIVENYDEFKGIVSDYLKETNPGKTADEIDDIAINTIDNILGMGDQSLALSDMNTRMAAGNAKFTKERVFLIPDERIEKFLDNRGSTVGSQYLSQADSMIQLKEMLNRNGWESINDARKALRDEYDSLIKAAPDEKSRAKLNKEFRSALELMNNMFRISLGHYG